MCVCVCVCVCVFACVFPDLQCWLYMIFVMWCQEEKQKRLGPGGLDPVEVMESLPEVCYICATLTSYLLKGFYVGCSCCVYDVIPINVILLCSLVLIFCKKG